MKTGKQLIINCGATHISAAIISSKFSGKLYLENLSFESLDYDYSQRDEWQPAIEAALRRLLIKNKFRGDPVLILPSCFFLHKLIRVPVVENSRQNIIVAYEVEQSIPDQYSEIVWDQYEVEEEAIIVKQYCGKPTGKTVQEICRGNNLSLLRKSATGPSRPIRKLSDWPSGKNILANRRIRALLVKEGWSNTTFRRV